jgi:orotate phosphoribosyltransferase-like protein
MRYWPDSRGNRLEYSTITRTAEGHILWLRGPEEAARQVLALAPEYERLPASVTANSVWTHALSSTSPSPTPEVQNLLALLAEVITLPSLSSLEFAIALDWYKIPEDDVDPQQWDNTTAGELVSIGKYRYRHDAERQKRVGLTLVDMMCTVIERHGLLRRTTVILDVPGHDSSRVSFGSRVASTIAFRRGIPMRRVQARSAFRPEAKNLDAAERARILTNQFVVPYDISQRSILIVDDVFKSGTSMNEVAKAARQSGALTVQGICGVRTMSR